MTECPYKDCKSKESLLTQVSRPGYCSRCTRWLGIPIEDTCTHDIDWDANEWKWQYWVANALGELIAAAPTIQSPHKEQIEPMITRCVEQIADGNMRAMARLSGVNVWTIRFYKYQRKIPYLETLLQICYKLSISPLEFLTNDPLSNLNTKKISKAEDMPTITTGRGNHVKASDIEKIRLVLERELAKTEPPYCNLVEIARLLGCSVVTLRKHCPELYSAITSRNSKKYAQDELHKLRKALGEMLLMENPPTLTKAAATLGCSVHVLRNHFPDLTKAIVAKNRERFSFLNVQKHLLEVLADNCEPFPSLKKTARSLGCSINILQSRCPDLCRKISERYKEYIHRRHAARISMLCEEVREAVLALHKQGTYPNATQISLYLSCPQLLLISEVHECWQHMLTELGWK